MLADIRGRLEWRVVGALLAVQVVLVALNGINTFTFHTDFLIIENEGNLPTWFSSMQFAFAAAACALAAWEQREALVWGVPAAALAFFSLDEIAMLHEGLEERTDEELFVQAVWPVLALAVVIAGYAIVRRLSGLTRLLVIGAGLALLLSQAFSAANSALDLPYSVSNVVSIGEEVWEMTAGALMLGAAAPFALRALRSQALSSSAPPS